MVASSRIHVLLDSHAQPHACMAVQRCRPEHTLIFVSGFSNLTDLPHHIFNASRLALDTKLAAQYIMATTTTIQVPATPPTPKTSSNHNSSALSLSPSSSSTTTTATTQSNLTKRQLSLVSSGGNVSSPVTTVAIVVAIYYGAVMLSYVRWTKHNDFREGCISDWEHELPLSAECLEELLRPRASVVKRQIEEAAHGFLSGEHSIRFTWVELAGSFVLGFAAGIGFDSLLKAKKPVPDVDIGAALRWLSRKTKAVVRGYGSYFAMLINVAWYSAMGLVVVFVGPFLLCCFLVVERREIFTQLRDTHSKAAQERRNLSGSLG
jgi:hypothetical protein